LLGGLLLVDGMRYAFGKVFMCLWDFFGDLGRMAGFIESTAQRPYCPPVGVILAGYNESECIEKTLQSIWGSYPRLQIVVVDDGSLDSMAERALSFSRDHEGVLVLRRSNRGGKSSAMNLALQAMDSEVVVVVDADSGLGPDAIWKIVQPLSDPAVGAVAGTILGRSPFAHLVTWLQAYEYLSSIFVGRMVAARLHMLGIVSGAFGAFRRAALDQVKGWDVGPPEDLDLTLAIRKVGYRIAFAPYAICYTDLPATWWGLCRQRLRWDQSGVIRNHCRKHLDMAFFWSANFHLFDFLLVLESWLTNIVCPIAIWSWLLWLCFHFNSDSWNLILTLYACYVLLEAAQALAVLYYSTHRWHDAAVCLALPLVPLYQFILFVVRSWALVRETLFHSSFDDNYVPAHVRDATWRW
jgi:cellulose synthase/poly-beta-1,6-N-acetylglucosamine synthase-like glycosyltransferase